MYVRRATSVHSTSRVRATLLPDNTARTLIARQPFCQESYAVDGIRDNANTVQVWKREIARLARLCDPTMQQGRGLHDQ